MNLVRGVQLFFSGFLLGTGFTISMTRGITHAGYSLTIGTIMLALAVWDATRKK